MSDREEILANFQSLSGISNPEVAIEILESTNWSLQLAIDLVASENDLNHQHNDVPQINLLEFNIDCDGRFINITAPDDESVGDLKLRIQGETDVNAEDQELTGFYSTRARCHHRHITDRQKLSELNLPGTNALTMKNKNAPSEEVSHTVAPADPAEVHDFTLIITVKKEDDGEENTHTVHFRPLQTVHRVKLDLADVTNIPVRQQNWVGWPQNVYDSLTLEKSGIPRLHKLYLSSSLETSSN